MQIEALLYSPEVLAGNEDDLLLKDLIRLCRERQLELASVQYLGSDYGQLVSTFRWARSRNRLFLSYGGTGGGSREQVRAAVAAACEAPLQLHAPADGYLSRVFGDRYQPRHRELVHFPRGSRLIPNPVSYVPGFSYANLFCLPAAPRSALPMTVWVLNKYARHSNLRSRHYCALLLKCSEAAALKIKEQLDALYPLAQILVLPKDSGEIELGFEGEAAPTLTAFSTAKVLVAGQGIPFQSTAGRHLPPG